MGLFAEYQTRKSEQKLTDFCEANNVSLQPLVDVLQYLMEETDLTDQEIYREFLQQAAKFGGKVVNGLAQGAGNLVGAAARGATNAGSNFAQGVQNGYGTQPNAQGTQQQANPATNAQQPNSATGSTTGQNTAPNAQQGQQSTQQMQQIKTMLQGLNQQNQSFGSTIQQLSKMFQQ